MECNKNSNKIANDVKFIPEIFLLVKFWETAKIASLRILVFAVNYVFVKLAKKYFPRKILLLINAHPHIVVACYQ